MIGRKGNVSENLGCSAFFGTILVLSWTVSICAREAWNARIPQALQECRQKVVSVGSDMVDPANEGKLVHVTGILTGSGSNKVDDLGIGTECLILKRNVEMFQWDEICEEKTETWSDGRSSTSNSYSYQKIWWPESIDSAKFNSCASTSNPPPSDFVPPSCSIKEGVITLGSFSLNLALQEQMIIEERLPLATIPPGLMKVLPNASQTLQNGVVFLGAEPKAPRIGDRRISYSIVKPRKYTIMGMQTHGGFTTFKTGNGCDILLISPGALTPEEMLSGSEKATLMLVKSERIAEFLMISLGFFLILWGLRKADLENLIPGRIPYLILRLISRFPSLFAGSLAMMVAWTYFHPPWFYVFFPTALVFLLVIKWAQKAKGDV